MNSWIADYFVDSFKSIASELPSYSLCKINKILVDEMLSRYDKLNQQTNLSTKEQKELTLIKDFIRKEDTRIVESGKLEDRINKYLDEHLPK